MDIPKHELICSSPNFYEKTMKKIWYYYKNFVNEFECKEYDKPFFHFNFVTLKFKNFVNAISISA